MWARLARFENEPQNIDGAIERIRGLSDAGDLPTALAGARVMMLVDRQSGGMIGLTLFDTEDALRTGDAAMNAGPGNAGRRSSVEFYEVAMDLAL